MTKVHIFEDNQTVAEAFAEYLFLQLQEVEAFHMALSGGSTPKVLFDHLAREYADRIDWTKLHLYWGDERCVPPTDEQSNYRMTDEKLLQHVAIPKANVHRVHGENDPQQEAIRYAEVVEGQLPMEDGLPVFDLIILGMGADGHTASIFPHQMELMNADTTCGVATHPESGQLRITLTGKVINAAKQIHFLVTGASKKPVLEEIFTRTGSYRDYPAAHIDEVEWWLDEAAGGD